MAWFDDIEKIVDLEDIQFTRNPRQLYDAHLRDPLISRRPERDVFVPMLAHALGKQVKLTRRQERTEVLMFEALANGVHPRKIAGYIADREGVTARSIRRRLKRADSRRFVTLENSAQMVPFAPQSPYISMHVDEQILGSIRANVPRRCAGGVKNADCAGYAPKKRTLCRACFEKYVMPYGTTLEDIEPYTVRIAIIEASRKIESQHRRDCIEIMMTRALTAAAV